MLLWEFITLQPEDQEANPSMPAAEAVELATRAPRLPYDRRCAAKTKSGDRCRGRIRPGSEFCPFHDPALAGERRRQAAARGGRSHHRLSHLPDGYLRKLTNRTAVGHAMDRLYREVRMGAVTPRMGQVLFGILARLLDSGLVDKPGQIKALHRTKAHRLRPKLSQLLTRAERAAWQKAVAQAPETFLHGHEPPLDEETRHNQAQTATLFPDDPGTPPLPVRWSLPNAVAVQG